MLRTSIAVTGAALAALTALTACGPVQMGAAAVLGDQTISSATLTSEVANWKAGYQAKANNVQLQFPQSRAAQQVLSWLVRFQVRERLAVRNHISVTPAQSQQALNATAKSIQANGATLEQVAVANGLPPNQLPELGRYLAIQNVLATRMAGGKLPTTQSGQQALQAKFGHSECLAAKSLSIKINPQYGRMDYARYAVVPATLTLAAPQGGVPTPSPSPQVTPAC